MTRKQRASTCVLACFAAMPIAARAPASTILDFGTQFSNVTITNNSILNKNNNSSNNSVNNFTHNNFGTNFSGQLGLSSNVNTVHVGSFVNGLFVGNAGNYNIESLDGTMDFSAGGVTGGVLSFTISNGTLRNNFSAEFAPGSHSISWDEMRNQFAITSGLRNIQLDRATSVAPAPPEPPTPPTPPGAPEPAPPPGTMLPVPPTPGFTTPDFRPLPPQTGFAPTPDEPSPPGPATVRESPILDPQRTATGELRGDMGDLRPLPEPARPSSGVVTAPGLMPGEQQATNEPNDFDGIEFTDTFAGHDLSHFFAFDGEITGSFFAFMYDGTAVDDTTSIVTNALVPLPPAAWAGLIGLALAGYARRRFKQ